MNNGLERLGILSIDDVRKLYREAKNKKTKYLVINGVTVKMSSQRYVVFLETSGTKCKCCKKEATYFAVERQKGSCEHYFLNLYNKEKKKPEVLMTKDHIIPRSLGGRSTIENYQTMCQTCNSRKGSEVSEDTLNKVKYKNLSRIMNEGCKRVLNLC